MLQGGSHSTSYKRRGVTVMSTFEALSLMFGFSMVLLTLLSVIVSITKNGKK